MILADSLKKAVLQAAIQGKLNTNISDEPSSKILVENLKNKKENLIADGLLKKRKESPLIEEDEILFDIPNNWSWVRLNDISEIITDGVHKTPKYQKEGVRFISATNIRGEKISFNNCKYITEELYKEINNRCHIRKNTLLISKSGSLGTVVIVEDDVKFGIFESLAVVNLVEGLNIQYMQMTLKYLFIIATNELSKGIGVKHLHLNVISNMIIPIPPLLEQHRIVDKINIIMPKIDEYEKCEKELSSIKKVFPDDMKKSILQSAIQGQLTEQLEIDSSAESLIDYIKKNYNKKVKEVENDTNFEFPEKWKHLKLVDATKLYTGNSISENIKKSKYMNLHEGYSYIGTKDVGFDHKVNYDNGVKIPFDEPKFKYADKDATILCIEGGSAGKKIAMLNEKVCFGNKLCAFHPLGINKKYLYYFLQSPVFLNAFMDKMSGMIGGVSINKIKQVIIPIPPIEEQQRIVEKLDNILPLCEDLKEE
jgi:type I restriction enzyme S subunit